MTGQISANSKTLQIPADAKDRADLSTWRTIGATIASLVIGAATPVFAYVTVKGQTVLSGPRMTIIAGIFSILSVLSFLLCFNLVTERVEVPANTMAKVSLPDGREMVCEAGWYQF